jgi:hypothetical protein
MLLGGVLWVCLYFRTSGRMTSSGTGVVISANEREITDSRGRRNETIVRCQFRLNNIDYEVEHAFRGNVAKHFPPGKSLPIRYNPGEPTMARIAVRD